MKKQKQGTQFLVYRPGICWNAHFVTEELQNKCCWQYKGENKAIRNSINCTGMNNVSPQTSSREKGGGINSVTYVSK